MKHPKKPLILIVDDTPHNIQLLSNLLFSEGFNINISTSGAHALLSVNAQTPDLILLDIQMPEMNGFEVCTILKSKPETKNIPIIFLTALTDSGSIMNGFELGAVDYITKPFNTGELFARVSTHIELKLSREKLLELNATKDKFFSIISHDLKNPFAALLSSCELQQRSIAKQDMVKIKKYADSIQESSKDAYKLLENLLTWSRLQMGKFEARKEQFNVQNLIDSGLSAIQNMIIEKDITIIISCNEKYEAWFDIEMFKAIIRNLTTNAVKFSNSGSKVNISIQEYDDKNLKVSIQDFGVGISKEYLTKLLRIDTNYTTSGTNNESGTGLGLILCKDYAEKNGSEIWVESEEDKGSTFSFTVEKFIDM